MAPAPAKKTTPGRAAGAADSTPDRADEVEAAERQRVAEVEAAQEATEEAAKGRAEVRRGADTKEERAAAVTVCVVSDGTPHVGRALPGKKICSAHEMHYLPDGTPRAKVHAAAQREALKPGGGTLIEHPGA